MKTYVQDGDKVVVAAPRALSAGDGALVGTMFGVAESDAADTADVVLVTEGVVDITKIGSQAWTVGARVYWDNSNFRCTTTASGNTLVGVAVLAVASGAGDTTGRVRLNGSF